MIVIDTNVLSALMRRDPEPRVVTWLDGLPAESVWTTAMTVFEVQFGLSLLVVGRRRRQLEEAFARMIEEDLEQRILPLDQSAAALAGVMAAQRRRAGRTVEIRDVLIAGIVSARKASLATGNGRHFEGLGLRIVDPWTA
jgi:predicted nucleic acid-binding protein